jgi:dihydroflavonol-4-reductase
MKILITGASGFLGSHLVRKALHHGYDVRAFVRPTSSLKNLEGLNVEIFRGDIRNKKEVKEALKGCQWLFHAAADYRFTSLHAEELLKTNVEGTKIILEAAKESNIERVVYTSSTATIGIPEDGSSGNEETPLNPKDLVGPYKQSKYVAELVAIKSAKEGLPVVIVNPSTPVGTHDSKPTPTGKFIVDFLNRKLFAYADTGLNLVDAEDVAEGHFLAAKKGKIGERYILGNQNLTFKDILQMLSRITGMPAPKVRLPYHVILFLAYTNDFFARNFLRRDPGIPLEGVRLSKKRMFFDPTKAKQELGLPQTPVEDALKKAVQWYQENGYVRK